MLLKTVPFTYNDIGQDDSNNPIVTVEGNNLTDDDYFFLNSGDYQHLMRVSKVNNALITTSDLEIMDVFTGTKYLIENKDFTAGQNVTINSQTYVFTNTTIADGAAGGFKVESDDAYAGTHRALFPYMELVAGEDFPRVAFINTTNLINDATGDVITTTADATVKMGRTYELPTGTIQFGVWDANHNGTVGAASNVTNIQYIVTPTGGSPTTIANITGAGLNISGGVSTANHTTIKVGEAAYTFGFTTENAITGYFATITDVTLDDTFTASTSEDTATDSVITSPVIMYIEDKDKADPTVDTRNVVILNTTDGGSSGYSELNNILFSGGKDEQNWDETKLTGYLTTYGTYALKDTTDTNINLGSISYGGAQMYADVYMAEIDASITAGASASGASQIGDILVKDSEVSSVATKNLIVVGGSCINSAAASLVGGAYCGAAWTTATNVGTGEFLIKGYASPSVGKFALLVAGYDAADTVNAATYLRNQALDTSKE